MFGQQKNTNNIPGDGDQNLNGKNYFDVENIPIHTMKDDLSGNSQSGKPTITDTSDAKTHVPPKNPSHQKISPFLSENSSWDNKSAPEVNKNIPISIRTESKTPENSRPTISQASPISLNQKKNSAETGTKWMTIGFSAAAACFIFILLWLGYRYWNNNQTSKVSIPVEEVEEFPPTPTLSYSETSPNYLRMENSISQNEEAKLLLKKTAEKVYSENYVHPIEFIPTNQQNSPMAFSDFALVMGIELPASVLTNLSGDFRLYFYNDQSGTAKTGLSKIGLSISTNNSPALMSALSQEEPNLPDQLSPLFFTSNFRKDKNYGDSNYKTSRIRFINIISPEELSIDYSIMGNELIIGTTKATIRAIIDKTAS